ncbi:MAG: multicopper oxidase domain-containing protein [Bacteroidetes bacterium]|nr:multicopper oxidase domain-containing protein [Bacteroidota bacterium]
MLPIRGETRREERTVTSNPTGKVIKSESPHTVRYDLYVDDTIVNYTGRKRHAIAINGSIPAPTLYFTEGDTAEIYVHNKMRHETSIHWHGIILPNQFDGVPYLTTAPIKAGQTHLFKFPVVQNGTYWYHSHTKVQEQSGMYGALIFYKRAEPDMKQLPLVLSDWADMKPSEIDRSLHNQTDWFSIRKNSAQSYGEAMVKGQLKTKLLNEWKRMTAMDVSDVAYDRFLINGESENVQTKYKVGDKVKLRVVNGGSSSYFWLSWAGGKITVVANDGNDVEPVEVDRLIIAVAETYDVIVTIPDDGSYEFLVTPEDRTKHASLWIGSGTKHFATPFEKLKYFEGMKMMNGMMAMSGNLKKMDGMEMKNQIMDMNTVMYPEITGAEKKRHARKAAKQKNEAHSMDDMHMDHANMSMPKDSSMSDMDMGQGSSDLVTLSYSMLRAPSKTTLPNWPTRTFYFELTGNMNRYVWTIGNKTVSESDKILIHRGENIRIVLYNNTMMRHPMHLHGHDFRVINGQGEYAPLKNVLDIMPMETDTIEFAGTESGDWFFHCHILYHMMSGMGRIFSYANSPDNSELPNKRAAQRKLFSDDREFHFMARAGVESNGTDGEAMLANTRWKIETMWHLGWHSGHGFESETSVGRYLGKMQWWYVFVGFDYHYKTMSTGMKKEPLDYLIAPNIFGNEYRNMFGQISDKNNRHTATLGVQYTLPMLIIAELRVDLNGKVRVQLSREDVPLTKRLRFSIMLNTDKEYALGLRYILHKYVSVSTHYDSDMGLGAGLTITY